MLPLALVPKTLFASLKDHLNGTGASVLFAGGCWFTLVGVCGGLLVGTFGAAAFLVDEAAGRAAWGRGGRDAIVMKGV